MQSFDAAHRAALATKRAHALFESGQRDLALSALAEAFPALTGAPGTRPFQPTILSAWAAAPDRTEAERDSAAFVLQVFDSRQEWGAHSDIITMMERCDAITLAVLTEWAQHRWG